MAARLLLLRHGQSTWNAQGRWQGWSDPPLSDLGREQAAEVGARLREAGAGLGLVDVAASDLDRARSTAAILAGAAGLGPVTVDPDLREYDVGDWEGLTRPEIEAGWPTQLQAWREGRLLATPGGETRSAFLARIGAALGRAGRAHTVATPGLIVTHGGVIRAAEQTAGGNRSGVIDNLAGRWFTVEDDGRLRAGERAAFLATPHRTSPPSP
ncbi:MAG: histidine phosphatase family protein [Acidimicrobiales bacterium]